MIPSYPSITYILDEIVSPSKSDLSALSFIKSRLAFVKEYCTRKGWNENDLSLDQVFEIRQQEEWKFPHI